MQSSSWASVWLVRKSRKFRWCFILNHVFVFPKKLGQRSILLNHSWTEELLQF